MSGPHEPDPTNAWQPPSDSGEAPASGDAEAAPEGASPWQQGGPGYPQTYPPSYPAVPGYPQTYGQAGAYGYGQPGAEPTGAYGSYGQPGQPGAEQTGGYGSYGQPGQPGPYGSYGQPGQPGQPNPYAPPGTAQYGQPGVYGQPVSPGETTGDHHLVADARKKFLGLPISGRAAVTLGLLTATIIAALMLAGFLWPGFFVTTELNVDKAQAGVQQILGDETNGYGAKNVEDVICNGGKNPVVKRDDSFDCEVSIDGTKRKVTVTFRDNAGTYEVGRPR